MYPNCTDFNIYVIAGHHHYKNICIKAVHPQSTYVQNKNSLSFSAVTLRNYSRHTQNSYLNTIGGCWYFRRVLVPLRLKNQSLYHKILLLQKFNDIGGKVFKHFIFSLCHHGGCQRLSLITLIKVASLIFLMLRRERGSVYTLWPVCPFIAKQFINL